MPDVEVRCESWRVRASRRCCSRLRSPAAACCPNAGKDETAGWSADQLYREAHDALLEGNYTRATKLFETLEARYPYGRYAQQAILESAYRQLARRRTGRGHRRLRPLHPHVSQSSERRLRVLPEGPRPFPRGPGHPRLRLRTRSVRARPEGNARVVRGVQGTVTRFPESQYYEDSILRMKYLNNALGDVRGQGRALLLQSRRLHRGRQSRAAGPRQQSADAVQRGCARRAGGELRQAGTCRNSRRTRGRSWRRRSPTASTSKGAPTSRGGSSGRRSRHDLRRAGHRGARDQAVVAVLAEG